MSLNHTTGALARLMHPAEFHPSKAPRDALWQLSIDAVPCTEVLPRVLGILSQQALLPLTMDYVRDADGLHLRIVVDRLDEASAAMMAGRVGRIVTVESVRLAPLGAAASG